MLLYLEGRIKWKLVKILKLLRQRQVDFCTFEASLILKNEFLDISATQRSPVLGKKILKLTR